MRQVSESQDQLLWGFWGEIRLQDRIRIQILNPIMMGFMIQIGLTTIEE